MIIYWYHRKVNNKRLECIFQPKKYCFKANNFSSHLLLLTHNNSFALLGSGRVQLCDFTVSKILDNEQGICYDYEGTPFFTSNIKIIITYLLLSLLILF